MSCRFAEKSLFAVHWRLHSSLEKRDGFAGGAGPSIILTVFDVYVEEDYLFE
jgi:hypothetical protein